MTGNRRNSDASWFQRAVDRYEGPLVRYAARLVGDVQRGQDVVQDTFLRLCGKSPAELDGHLAAWLFAVCRNRALDVRRKETRMRPLSKHRAEASLGREADQAVAVEARETVQQLEAILAQLPESQQEVIRLKFQDGMSYRQISEITDLTVSNVGYVIHRAIKRIREELSRREDE
jgi:RNA polymerase sigma-70 factor (ECF subfamily)